MRVVHVPYTYAPDPAGGTEVFVASLVKALREYGVDGIVAAPGARDESYDLEGIRVRRFGTSDALALDALYGEGDARAARGFAAILDAERPQLVHFHAMTSASSMLAMHAARERRLPAVFTYHTPTVTCQRGTLLRHGRTVCDGLMEVRRCTSCTLHGHGLSRALSALLAGVPKSVGRKLGKRGLGGGAWTALRMSSLLDARHAAVRAFLHGMDRIVAPSAWVRQLLVLNGIAAERILVCGQGVSSAASGSTTGRGPQAAALKVAFFGRLDPVKGAHILLAALRKLPAADIRLDLYAVPSPAETAYGGMLRAQAAGDSRVTLAAPVESSAVVALMKRYDLVAVPSQGLETGPLVVLEAFAAGTPVIASDLGGIAERVRDGGDGLLVPYADVGAWAAALERTAHDRSLLARLKAGVTAPPTMQQTGAAMRSVYLELAGPR